MQTSTLAAFALLGLSNIAAALPGNGGYGSTVTSSLSSKATAGGYGGSTATTSTKPATSHPVTTSTSCSLSTEVSQSTGTTVSTSYSDVTVWASATVRFSMGQAVLTRC